MKVRVTGAVLSVTQRSYGGKDGKQPFRFTEVAVFSEDAAALEPVRFMSEYQGQIPGRGEVVDLICEVGAFANRPDLTVVAPWPSRPVAVQPPAQKSA